MSLSDWTQYESAGFMTVSIDITTPLVDSGSLKVDPDQVVGQGGWNAHLSAPFSKGFTKGRIRTLSRWDRGAPFITSHRAMHTGIICMQSQLDLTGTVGKCYTFALGGREGADGGFYAVVNKVENGLSQSTTGITELHQELVPGYPPTGTDDHWPMELEWQADLAGLGGTRLIARIGTKGSTDFGTMTDIYDAVDTTSPLLTSVAEGIFCRNGDPTPDIPNSTYIWTLDETTIFELT